MNDKTGGNRGLWDAGALAVAAVVAVVATACGGGSAPSAPVTAAIYPQQTLAKYIPFIGQLEQKVRQARQEEVRAHPELQKYFQCVQSHGGPTQAALSDCQHLLPAGMHASLDAAA